MKVSKKKVRRKSVISSAERALLRAYTREQAEQLLPAVGDHLMKVPSVLVPENGVNKPIPRRCVVVEVNPFGLWYRVRFAAGYHECIKVPEV